MIFWYLILVVVIFFVSFGFVGVEIIVGNDFNSSNGVNSIINVFFLVNCGSNGGGD